MRRFRRRPAVALVVAGMLVSGGGAARAAESLVPLAGALPWSGVSDTTWDPQPMSALFELWGPAGSIELGGAGSDGGEELAETGQDGSTISTFAAAGFAVGALGIALMVARRRQAQA